MSLSIQYSKETEKELRGVLEEMLAEAFLMEPVEGESEDNASNDLHAAGKAANLIGEVMQLVTLCRAFQVMGQEKRYELHVHVTQNGPQWQYFQLEK
ncbi:MAG TPA: hypothetical protein VNF06_00795 [Candidatus Aquilonibacter sp.]|nr:hypothetical protein [Candidatus Aquilonibacter sp.]